MKNVLSPKVIEWLISNMQIEFGQPGEQLYENGGCDKFYIITKGSVDIKVNGSPSIKRVPGDHFGVSN